MYSHPDRLSQTPPASLRMPLAIRIAQARDKCIRCSKCTAECAFLRENGTPGEIAGNYNPADPAWLVLPYDCHLCGLCAAVCPVDLSPEALFLEMRREAVDRGMAPLPAHRTIMAYERRGTSRKYSWYALPVDCDTILFPGCTFAGTRMDTTIALYQYLKGKIPNMGIVLDCCCKPSHDLGREAYFRDMFREMHTWLTDHGVRSVIVVCPNCYKVFKTYGRGMNIVTAYELLATEGQPLPGSLPEGVAQTCAVLHDPCVLRDEAAIQSSVRVLAESAGFAITEMPHGRRKTVCCGEGGSVGFVHPEFSDHWADLRRNEAGNRRILTCCAGCAGYLGRKTSADHILDAIFHPQAVAEGSRKTTKAPFTYFNRIRLKRYLQGHHPAPVTRERDFLPASGRHARKGGTFKKIAVIAGIAAAMVGIRISGLMDQIDPESLRRAVMAAGPLAPAVFMALYAIAPALFMPGLPLTLAGGIFFGPFWGVVYSITGATAGASIAFLISRYVARDWIRAKLSGPRWRRLESGVEKNGWKIVAFTRLVPLFPFNLLNYAFGLTPIKFLPYAVTSFVCMLPACIAFIVFSSSLMDLLKGNISPAFLIGLLLIAVVSFVPVFLRKFKSPAFQHDEHP